MQGDTKVHQVKLVSDSPVKAKKGEFNPRLLRADRKEEMRVLKTIAGMDGRAEHASNMESIRMDKVSAMTENILKRQ